MNFSFPSRLRGFQSERGEPRNRPSSAQNGMARRLVTSTTVLVSLSVLSLGLTAGSAAASGAGVVTTYTGTGIHDPQGIAAGPDGALWFTNIRKNSTGSIGRITGLGGVTNYASADIGNHRDRSRSRRCDVVHQQLQQLYRADHGGSGIVTNHSGSRHHAIRNRGRDQTGLCGLPTPSDFDRADHDLRGGHGLYRSQHRRSPRNRSRSRRCDVVH